MVSRHLTVWHPLTIIDMILIMQDALTDIFSDGATVKIAKGATLFRTQDRVHKMYVVRTGRVDLVGAGPGDPDLITVKGQRLIAECPVCLYAGSLVPEAIVAGAPQDAIVKDTAPMTLDEIIDDMVDLPNGFTVSGRAAVVDKSKFDLSVGEPIALKRIEESVWQLEGYRLQQELFEAGEQA